MYLYIKYLLYKHLNMINYYWFFAYEYNMHTKFISNQKDYFISLTNSTR